MVIFSALRLRLLMLLMRRSSFSLSGTVILLTPAKVLVRGRKCIFSKFWT
ncbi:hypothetical protein Plhal304r1_c016g0059481 [Plasmopara halstedii]